MIKNYPIAIGLKIAIRNLRRNKTFTLLNIFGLSVGIAAALLILLYINDELAYDHFLPNSKNIYQVNLSGNFSGQQFKAANTPPPVGQALTADYPGIESSTRIFKPGDVMISGAENTGAANYFTESNVLAVDSNFLQLFQFPLVQGNALTALQGPNTMVISENMANKYFNSTNVSGKTLLFGNKRVPYKITAVIKNIPAQSSLQFGFLVPMATYEVVNKFSWSWIWLNVDTYVKLSNALANDPVAIKKLESTASTLLSFT